MMQKIMRQVITNITEDPARKHRRRREPIVEKYRVRQLPERGRQRHKQRRGHHKAVAVHGEVVMDPVQQEMQR